MLAVAAAAMALILFATMNYTNGYNNQPLQTFLPCDISKVIYADDLGRQTWSASNPAFVQPFYKPEKISIQHVQDTLALFTNKWKYTSKKLTESSFDAMNTYGFYDAQGNCLFELFLQGDTVLVHANGNTTKLKRKR